VKGPNFFRRRFEQSDVEIAFQIDAHLPVPRFMRDFGFDLLRQGRRLPELLQDKLQIFLYSFGLSSLSAPSKEVRAVNGED
jgi:hypothetical protein